jgi:hypothetical protein
MSDIARQQKVLKPIMMKKMQASAQTDGVATNGLQKAD